jgi:UDP-N-acetylglucosamine 2-epimerase
MNFNLFELIKFLITYPRVQLFSRFHIAHHKINEPTLTLCSTISWKDKLEKQGFDEKNLKVIGTPLYDNLFDKTKGVGFKHTNLEKLKILFCTASMHEHGMWSKEIEDGLIKNTINKLNEHEDFQVSLKIHPVTSSIDEYRKLIKETKLDVKLYQKESFLELIKEYDVIITYGPSSIVHECILLRKPIVLLQLINESSTESMYDEDIINICKNLDNIFDDINDAQNKTINQTIMDEQIEKMIGKFDGECSERAVNEILGMIK